MTKYICKDCGLIQREQDAMHYTEEVECGEFWGAPCTQTVDIIECGECGGSLTYYGGAVDFGEYATDEERE